MHKWKTCHVWGVAGSGGFTSISCHGGSDIIRRSCPAMPGSGAQSRKTQRHQKGFNLKNSRPVQCQLSLNPPPPPSPSRRAPAAGQGWRGNLIKGSPVTKAPPLLPASSGRLRETKGHKMGLALCSQESWSLTAAPPQTVWEENTTRDGEVRGKHEAALLIGSSFFLSTTD